LNFYSSCVLGVDASVGGSMDWKTGNKILSKEVIKKAIRKWNPKKTISLIFPTYNS